MLDEPADEDWITEDHVTFTRVNTPRSWERRVIVPDGAEWRDVLAERMRADRFFPDVWLISDHGNTVRIS